MNKDAVIRIRVSLELKEALKAIAAKRGLSFSELVRMLIDNFVATEGAEV